MEAPSEVVKQVGGEVAVSNSTSVSLQAMQQIINGQKQVTAVSADEALRKARELSQMLHLKGKTQSASNPDQKTHWECEVEINDFPQQARWKVTHKVSKFFFVLFFTRDSIEKNSFLSKNQKDALNEISEYTETAIITKGTYIPPGKNAGFGERKLYLLIEGASESAVKLAKREILRILGETTTEQAAMPIDKRYTKYSVL